MKKKYLKLKENKKKINITESQYRNIFENMEDEIRTENPDGTVEIDNFDLISSRMKEDPKGDTVYYFFVRLVFWVIKFIFAKL